MSGRAEFFFDPEDRNEEPRVLDLALKMALDRGGQTTPVSDFDITNARERITGEAREIDLLRRENAELRATIARLSKAPTQ